jgi:hypothetical protein
MGARFSTAAFFVLATACSNDSNGTVALTVGGEADALTRSPAVTKVHVELVSTTTTVLFDGALGDNLNLGTSDPNASGAIHFLGFDASNTARVEGYTLPVQLGALAYGDLPLFVQRKGEWARAPDAFGPNVTHTGVLGQRYIAGFDDAGVGVVYDLLSWQKRLDVDVKTPVGCMLAGNTTALVLSKDHATEVDFSTGGTAPVAVPTTVDLAAFDGATPTYASGGAVFVVGGTSTTGPETDAALFVDTNGTIVPVTLTAKRKGAAAVWLQGRGLLVVGGSATAAGAELVPSDGVNAVSASARLAFPPIVEVGLGAAVLGGSRVAIASPPRVLDAACVASCGLETWATPAVALARSSVFAAASDGTSALVVGNDPAGTTRAFRVSTSAAVEVATRVPRSNAAALALPTGQLALLGGGNAVFETFLP